jgi:hypothetical protein
MRTSREKRFWMQDCFGVAGVLYISAILFLLLPIGHASGTPLQITNANVSMSCGDSQPLSASGGCTPYYWRLSGGGTLTANGTSATYDAPTSNTDCAYNPTITVTDFCRNTAEIKIAVNCYTSSQTDRVLLWQRCNCCEYRPGDWRGDWFVTYYNCENAVTFQCETNTKEVNW